MSKEVEEFFQKAKRNSVKMKEQVPEAVDGFRNLFTSIMKDGAISLREKELIAVAIGVNIRCEPCIRHHVNNCLEAGATKAQILEAASVAVMMGGGPAYTQMPVVINTLKALEQAQ